jgi:hypothetical protein
LEPRINLKKNIVVGYYIAGLWEGDGHGDRKHQKYIAFTFHQKDKPLAEHIQRMLGGTLRHKQKEHAYVLTLRKQDALQTFFTLIQHKLRTPKHSDLQGYGQSVGDKDTTAPWTNAWFAGFFDADGSFQIRYTKQRRDPQTQKILTKHRIALRCVLEQRKYHPKTNEPYFPVLQQIANWFDIPVAERKHGKVIYWCLEISSLKKIGQVIAYFDTFPLLSSKFLEYQDWKQVYLMLCRKEHLQKKGKAEIWKIKQRMNRRRQRFCWQHLQQNFRQHA